MFKTLLADVDGQLVVGIVPVTGQLDLGALAKAVGGKRATMADPALAQRRTGYVLGGISPIGQRTAHPTVLDETAELFDTVYVSGGRRGFDLGLAPADLITATGARSRRSPRTSRAAEQTLGEVLASWTIDCSGAPHTLCRR